MQEMTYVANRPIQVRGERREAGALVPEAADWSTRRAYISRGKLSAVPRGSVDQDALKAAEDAWREALEAKRAADAPEESSEAPDTSGEEEEGVETTSEEEPEEEESRTYEDLNADEVKSLVESGKLDPDQALEAELNREDGGRKGVLKFLESLDEG